jgi:TonB-linked outer membrane protein, SusC/RagA family
MQKTAFCNRNAIAVPGNGCGSRRLSITVNARFFRFQAKTLLVMRLTIFFLIAAFMNVSATGLSQTITLSGKQLSMEKVFTSIEKQTGYFVMYKYDLLQKMKPVTIDVRNMPLNQFLNRVLKEQHFDYTIDNKTILVVPENDPPVPGSGQKDKNVMDQQPLRMKVEGTILQGDTREPLSGASVAIKGKQATALSDEAGHFTIEAAIGDVLSITYVGYVVQEFTVRSEKPVTILLKQQNKSLSEIVVVAYGTQNKRTLTGAQASVNGEELVKAALPSVTEMLQGKVPGLQSVSSGQPGGNSQIRIRGISSITAGSEPLYVVDGIPVNSGDLARGTTTSNALAGLNPNDIESVAVLKDAASASIYGSRAANGVIVITTKKGKKGPTRFQVNTEAGFTDMKLPDIARPLGKEEYLALTAEGMRNAGYTEQAIETQLTAFGKDNPETNWLDEVTRKGNHQQVNVSASGGNERTLFNASVGYFKQQATTINSNFKRFSGNLSLQQKASEKLLFRLGINSSFSKQNTPSNSSYYANPVYGAFLLRPTQNPYNPDGSINLSLTDFPNGGVYNQIAEATLNIRDYKNIKALTFGRIEYKPVNNLTLSSQYGIDLNVLEEYRFMDPRFGDGYAVNGRGTANYTRYFNWTWTNLAEYHLDINRDQAFYADLKAGYEAQKSTAYLMTSAGTNFPGSSDLTSLVNAASPTTATTSGNDYSFNAFLSNALISFKNKYILTGSFRRDASSRFGMNKRYGNFYSIGAAWSVSEENFWHMGNAFPYLKLRSSYGVNGNANIGNYDWRATYGLGNNYNQAPGSLPTAVGNNNLTWELNTPFNIGFDAGFFSNRLTLTVDYYHRKTSQLLLDVPLSQVSGFSTMIDNVGAMVNKGWEFLLNASVIDSKDLNWDLNFNVAFNKNRITELYDGQDIISGQYIRREGYDFQTFYMREWAGVDPATGDPLWYLNTEKADGSLDKTTTNNYNAAQRVLTDKSASPSATGGFGSVLSFKGITLDAQFSFTFGNYLRDGWVHYYFSDGFNPNYNRQARALDRWQKPGDITDVPRYVYGGNRGSYQQSTRFLYKGDFIRLRSLTLSYDLPSTWMSLAKMSSTRLYLRGTNLFRITFDDKLPMDPELGINGQQDLNPFINQVFTAGININF